MGIKINNTTSSGRLKISGNSGGFKVAKLGIVTDGLVLSLDAANINSYPGTGTDWYDLSGNGTHCVLTNSPTWNSSGYFSFDGIDDGADNTINPQNYVDLMIGMYGLPVGGLEMVFAKYNDFDKSFRTNGGFLRHSGIDSNDWNYLNTSYDFVNGSFITTDANLSNSWNVIRLVNQNSSFSPPFNYSISSDFLNRRYRGYISFVLCYNRILTSEEVQQNYNAQKSRFGL